jgi:hypothetical protein
MAIPVVTAHSPGRGPRFHGERAHPHIKARNVPRVKRAVLRSSTAEIFSQPLLSTVTIESSPGGSWTLHSLPQRRKRVLRQQSSSV